MRGLWLVLLALGCSKRDAEKPQRSEPWENPAYRSSASASLSGKAAQPGATERYVLRQGEGSIHFSLPAKEQTPRGTVQPERGELLLERAGDDWKARATVVLDLQTLAIADGAEGEGGAWTTRAREWLELGAAVPERLREQHRRALVEVASVELSPLSAGGRRSKTRDAVAHGQLSLHGFRVRFQQGVSAEFGEGEPPSTLRVRSRKPLVVNLSEHDLKPRNAEGHVLAEELSLLGKRVGREARVDFELIFERAEAPKNPQ